jgi:hypothetical protein
MMAFGWPGRGTSLPAAAAQFFDLPIEPGEIFFPNGVVRRELCQRRHDRLALAQGVARF